jgi:competence protein ComEA
MRILFMLLGLVALLSVQVEAQKPAGSSKGSAGGAVATASAPVNLNTATQSQLETLPGVGPKAAQRILEYRQKNGSFKKIEDLMHVQGIGEKNFLKLKPLITVADKGDRQAGTI